MKKICSLVLSVCMITSLIFPSAALSPTTDTEITFLQNYGIPNKLLQSVSDEVIHDLYVHAQSDALRYGGTTTTFLHTSEEDKTVYGTIPSADMSLTISPVIVLKYNSTAIDYILFMIDYDWADGHPTMRKTDGVTVNWNSNLFYMQPDSFESIDYCNLDGKFTYEASLDDPSLLEQGGLGYSVNLRNAVGTIYSYNGTATFCLGTQKTLYYDENGGNYSTSINITYAHDRTPIVGSINFSKNGGGVSMSLPSLSDSVSKNIIIKYI